MPLSVAASATRGLEKQLESYTSAPNSFLMLCGPD